MHPPIYGRLSHIQRPIQEARSSLHGLLGNHRVQEPNGGLIGPKKPRESRKEISTVELGLEAHRLPIIPRLARSHVAILEPVDELGATEEAIGTVEAVAASTQRLHRRRGRS